MKEGEERRMTPEQNAILPTLDFSSAEMV